MLRRLLLSLLLFLVIAAPLAQAKGPTTDGPWALIKGGVAHAPTAAPDAVKEAIWAANTLLRKPYRWGGGHARFHDKGYDCSGTISFLLHHAGMLKSPAPSSHFRSYGNPGRGKWITIYARKGHVFAVVAGLRLDTTDFRGGRQGPRWHQDFRPPRGFTARHPPGL